MLYKYICMLCESINLGVSEIVFFEVGYVLKELQTLLYKCLSTDSLLTEKGGHHRRAGGSE